jgi:DnaJ-class molecular chaperone
VIAPATGDGWRLSMPAPRADRSTIAKEDPTCPDCKGAGIDKHDFDCRRCAGEGVIDE